MRKFYAIAAIVLLVVEVLIALFVRDQFVRPYLGDVLAVMLVHAVLRAATGLGVFASVAVALSIALAIELGQAFDLLGALGLGDNQFARVILGGVFDLADIAAYLAGAVAVIVLERLFRTAGRGSGA